jgi:hypothetical protein
MPTFLSLFSGNKRQLNIGVSSHLKKEIEVELSIGDVGVSSNTSIVLHHLFYSASSDIILFSYWGKIMSNEFFANDNGLYFAA